MSMLGVNSFSWFNLNEKIVVWCRNKSKHIRHKDVYGIGDVNGVFLYTCIIYNNFYIASVMIYPLYRVFKKGLIAMVVLL